GWKNVIDLGDITTARGTESYMPLWLRLYMAPLNQEARQRPRAGVAEARGAVAHGVGDREGKVRGGAEGDVRGAASAGRAVSAAREDEGHVVVRVRVALGDLGAHEDERRVEHRPRAVGALLELIEQVRELIGEPGSLEHVRPELRIARLPVVRRLVAAHVVI